MQKIKGLAEKFKDLNLKNKTLCNFLIYCCIRDSVNFKEEKFFDIVKRQYLRYFKKNKVKYN